MSATATAAAAATATAERKPARWALLSTARVNRHIVAVSNLPATDSTCGVRIAAVTSRSLEKAVAYATSKDTGIANPESVRCFGSFEEMLATSDADLELDCIYISTPNNAHVAPVMACIASNKAPTILCEKPMALRAAEVDGMFAAAEAQGIVLMEGYMNLHSNVVHRAKQLIVSGAIGAVKHMSGVFTYVESRGGFRRACGVADGGGALFDVGCYVVSLANFLAGRVPAAVQCIQETEDIFADAAAATEGAPRKRVDYLDMSSTATLLYDRLPASAAPAASPLAGAFACQFFTSFNAPLQMGFTVVGTKGTLRIANPFKPDPTKEEEIEIRHDIAQPPVVHTAKGAVGTPAAQYLYQGECEVLSKIAQEKRAPPAAAGGTGAEGGGLHFVLSREFSVGNAAVIEALHASGAKGGETVKVALPAA